MVMTLSWCSRMEQAIPGSSNPTDPGLRAMPRFLRGSHSSIKLQAQKAKGFILPASGLPEMPLPGTKTPLPSAMQLNARISQTPLPPSPSRAPSSLKPETRTSALGAQNKVSFPFKFKLHLPGISRTASLPRGVSLHFWKSLKDAAR